MKKVLLLTLIVLPLLAVCQNDNFATSKKIDSGSDISGTVSSGTQNEKYFQTVLPSDGTLKIYIIGKNTAASSGYLYMYGYDRRKASGTVFGEYIQSTSIKAGENIADTITVYGRAADTFYFRISTSQKFEYNFSYTMTDTSPNDNEPNGNFNATILVSHKEQKKGHIGFLYNGTSDQDDYYGTVLPQDGTLNIYVTGTNRSGNSGYLYMYGYDRRKAAGTVFGEYIQTTSAGPGAVIHDTITAYGRAADTFYFRLVSSQPFEYSFSYEITDVTPNDNELNDDFDNALAIGNKEVKQGHIGYLKNGKPDDNDYYKTRLPFDGSLKIIVEGINKSGGSGYLYLNGYDKRKASGNVFGTYVSGKTTVKPGEQIFDTLIVNGRQADSFYYRFTSSQAFDYKISFEMIEDSETDDEPNNSFEEAVPIKNGLTKTGQVSYKTGTFTDADDYFVTILPADGTLKVYVKGTNTSSSAGYLYMYGYDRRKASGTVFGEYIQATSIKPGESISDTISVYGRAADTFYFRINSSQPFTYTFSYEMTDFSPNDEEPNGGFETANSIAEREQKNGHAGYLLNGTSDLDDYYVTTLPADGTLKVYVKGTNTSSLSGYLYMYGYDKRKASGTVYGQYIQATSIKPGESISDTISVYGRAADTFYFRLNSSQPFSYSFSYEMTDISPNDEEPNGGFETARNVREKELKRGHIGYLSNGTSDGDDYYVTNLPADGTLKVYVKGTNTSSASGYLYMYGYDKRKASGTVYGEYIQATSIKPGESISDTITVYGRAVDTFYFRINSSQPFSYSFSYEMADTSANDMESNGIFEDAIPLQETKVAKGHIGYLANGSSDNDDYYSTVLPSQGTLKIYVNGKNTSGRSGYLYLYAYDGRKSSAIAGEYIAGTSIRADSLISDTIVIHCLAIDSIYFRMAANVPFTYDLSYEMEGNSASDAEDNNSYETAIPLKTDSVYRGTTGYYKGGISDTYDYYKTILPSKGHVTLFMEGTNTSGNSGRLQVQLYDKNKRLLQTKVIDTTVVATGQIVRDSLTLQCLSTDTLYVRITSTYCFTYSFSIKHDNKEPKADMTHERLGNTIGFRPQLSNAGQFLWTFGDTTTSRMEYPMHTFLPGNYTTRLIATNPACNFKDTASYDFTIKGVEYYTPLKAGVGGDLNMSVFGGGLASNTKITLVKGDIKINPIEIHTNSELNHLTALFNIHLSKPGSYDVIIDIPGEETIIYKDGITLDEFIYPVTWSEIQGPDRWRINSDTKFRLIVGNNGNVMASGVVVALLWPEGVSVKFENKSYTPPASGTETVVVDGETFSLPRSDYRFIYDELETVTAIDTFNLKPYKGHIQYLLIPNIPVGSKIELPFIANSSGTGNASFQTYTFKSNQRGSCENPVYNDFNGDLTAELIDGIDMAVDQSNVVPLKVLSKTAKIGQKHAGSAASYMGKKFWAWYDGYEFNEGEAMAEWLQETEANNAFALQTATDELGSLLFDKASAKMLDRYKNQVDFINKRLASNPNMSAKLTEAYLDKLNSLPHDQMRRFEALKGIFDNTKQLGTLSDKLVKLQQLADDCPELKEQIEDLLKQVEKELDIRDPKDKKTDRVTSLDPNEISGPAGVGAERYVNNTDHHHFTIFFENVDTAKASAQIVLVRDTLDKTKYDLSTFEFGGMSIGTKTVRLPNGRKQFVIERNIEQNIPVKVRINGSIDTATGAIEWQFTSIDTTTNWLPVLEGFLPPNKQKPEGEGYVSFSVRPLATLPDGTEFTNRASIIFDQNEPILTNTWKNILDIGKPASTVSAKVSSDTLIHLTFDGSDAVSGMGYYNLYVKTNNGVWRTFSGASTDTLTLTGQKDSTYSFYVVSADKVGNLENKNASAEATVTLASALNIQLGDISAVNLDDKNRIDWNTFHEDNGDYFVLERSANGNDFLQLATIKGNGSGSRYSFPDDEPMPGRNYYRLKMYNFHGQSHYSKVVMAEVKTAFMIQLFPNPVKNILKIKIHGIVNAGARISLTTVYGQEVYKSRVVGNQMDIEMNKLAGGIYFMRYEDTATRKVFRIVKE